METLDVGRAFFCLADDVHRVGREIDDRSAGDADFRDDVGGGEVTVGNSGGAGRCAVRGVEKSDLPERSAGGVRVEGVDAVMFGGDEDDVVGAFAGDGDTLHIKGLCIDAAVNRIGEELAEIRGGDVGGSEDGFVGVGTGAQVVVVLRDDVHLRGKRQCRGKAKCA